MVRLLAGIGCGILVAASLGACRQEEQGRILLYEKGTYLGKADQKLSEKQVREVQLRARNQRF